MIGQTFQRLRSRRRRNFRSRESPPDVPASQGEYRTEGNLTSRAPRDLPLTTYRRDGRPVTTPVWAAPVTGSLYVVAAKSTGKARRLRATSRVRFAPSNMSGRRILDEWPVARVLSRACRAGVDAGVTM